MKSDREDIARLLSGLAKEDYLLSTPRRRPSTRSDFRNVVREAIKLARHIPLVYTAYDGDHFQFCPQMRRLVLEAGMVPANPESILCYKEAVVAHQNKRGVLQDDLAVLRRCDQLWIFTDLPPSPGSIPLLAEGVVIELLFYLRRARHPRISFVPVGGIARGRKPSPIAVAFDYDRAKEALDSKQRRGVLNLANSVENLNSQLRPILFHIYDPLDFKYSDWLFERAYDGGFVPLVPGLAVPLGDMHGMRYPLGQAILSWVRLMFISDSACIIEPMNAAYGPSETAEIMKSVWEEGPGRNTPLISRRWLDYRIPKAAQGRAWPLTEIERDAMMAVGE